MKIHSLAIILVMLVISSFSDIRASEKSNEIEISVLSNQEYYQSNMEVQVQVKFNNHDKYNDQVYLSYHIYDHEEKELVWEGERLPIQVDEDFIGKVDLNIDLTKYVDIDKNELVYVKFDLVDEKNIYWLSDNKEEDSQLPIIRYEKNKLKEYLSIYISAVTEHTIIFILNFATFIMAIYFIYRICIKQKVHKN